MALAFAGCVKDAAEDNFTTCPVEGTATVSASIETVTRTSLNDPDEGVAQVLWSEGDVIGVITSDGTIRRAVLAEGAGTTNGLFTVSDAVEGETYDYAFYPYIYNGNTESKKTVAGTTLSLNLPAFQTYSADGVFSTSTNTMVATADDGGRLNFKSVMGCLELKISGSQTVRGITVKNSVTKVAGEATIDLEQQTLAMGTANTSFSFAYLECPEKVQLSETPTSFYVLLPVGTYDCLQIGILTDDGSYVRSATSVHTVKRATVKPVNCGNLDTMIDTSSAIDLSAAGYANCYIVSPSGSEQVYSFETKFVDGTPVENPKLPGSGDKSLAFFSLIWAEDLNIAYDIRFDKAEGKVYFKYDGKTVGNVRIAGCNDFFASADISTANVKRALESIVWAWHIWATDAPSVGITVDGNNVKDLDGDGTITTEEVARANKINIMDRNLGATWAPENVSEVEGMTIEQATASAGCFYQFGNPHPYPRQKQLGENGSNWQYSAVKYRFGFSQYVQDWTASGGSKTHALVNMYYPMYRYATTYVPSVVGNNAADKYNNQWLKADIIGGNSAANDASKDLCLWGGQGSKTNYDPCPAGWVVPHRGNIYQMTIGAPKTINGASVNVTRPYFQLGPQSGEVVMGSYVSYDGVACDWHPFSGYMGSGSISASGTAGYYWGCGYYGTSYTTTSTKLQYNMASYARTPKDLDKAGKYLNNSTSDAQCSLAIGYQVRCVKRN